MQFMYYLAEAVIRTSTIWLLVCHHLGCCHFFRPPVYCGEGRLHEEANVKTHTEELLDKRKYICPLTSCRAQFMKKKKPFKKWSQVCMRNEKKGAGTASCANAERKGHGIDSNTAELINGLTFTTAFHNCFLLRYRLKPGNKECNYVSLLSFKMVIY